jgi:hypothetical protein
VLLEFKDYLAPEVRKARLVLQEPRGLQVQLAPLEPLDYRARLAHKDPPAQPALKDPLAHQEVVAEERQAQQDLQVLLVLLVPQDQPAPLARLD